MDGVIGFWVVAIEFFVWVFVMWVTTLHAINSDTKADDGRAGGRAVGAVQNLRSARPDP